MKKLFISALALCMCFTTIAQENSTSIYESLKLDPVGKGGLNNFYAEGGGAGIMFSANYDRRFQPTRLGAGFRIGLGFVSADENVSTTGSYNYQYTSAITVPAQINYIFGKTNSSHTFEVGAGLTYVSKKLDIMNFYDKDKTNLFGTASFMYRRQPIDGGFLWRIGFTPLISKGIVQVFGGVGIGYSF